MPGTRLPAGLQILVPLVGLRRRENRRWGDTPGSPASGSAPAAMLGEFRFPRDWEHFPSLSQADPLPCPICLVIGPRARTLGIGRRSKRLERELCRPSTETQTGGTPRPGPFLLSYQRVRGSKPPLCSGSGDRTSSLSYLRPPSPGAQPPFSLVQVRAPSLSPVPPRSLAPIPLPTPSRPQTPGPGGSSGQDSSPLPT